MACVGKKTVADFSKLISKDNLFKECLLTCASRLLVFAVFKSV